MGDIEGVIDRRISSASHLEMLLFSLKDSRDPYREVALEMNEIKGVNLLSQLNLRINR